VSVPVQYADNILVAAKKNKITQKSVYVATSVACWFSLLNSWAPCRISSQLNSHFVIKVLRVNVTCGV